MTSYVLYKIIKQYDLIKIIKKSLSRCINVFIKIMSLSCAYKIQKRIYDIAENEILRIKNIHSHWRFISSAENSSFKEFTSEFISEETSSELIDVEMNYDNFTFLMLSLSNLALSNLALSNLALSNLALLNSLLRV